MKDIKLSDDPHDIEIKNFDLQIIEGIEGIRQKIRIVLLFVSGDWYLDTGKGIRLFRDIMKKRYDIKLIKASIITEVRRIPGVLDILKINVDLDRKNRILNISMTVKTIYGETSI